eukprot:XP_027308385.1 uncharacterized protein LOC113842903 [Anas platyrhynchos]
MKPGALLCCAGDGALAQAAQRLWGLLLGALQQPPGRGAGHPALGVPAWPRVAPAGSRGGQPQPPRPPQPRSCLRCRTGSASASQPLPPSRPVRAVPAGRRLPHRAAGPAPACPPGAARSRLSPLTGAGPALPCPARLASSPPRAAEPAEPSPSRAARSPPSAPFSPYPASIPPSRRQDAALLVPRQGRVPLGQDGPADGGRRAQHAALAEPEQPVRLLRGAGRVLPLHELAGGGRRTRTSHGKEEECRGIWLHVTGGAQENLRNKKSWFLSGMRVTDVCVCSDTAPNPPRDKSCVS